MPLPILPLAMGALSAAPKLLAAFQQNRAADKVVKQDTTTAAEREALAMSRQAAATRRLPGMGAQQNRLAQVQAGATQNARLGAASSADFLAAAGAADQRRQQGEMQLGVQGQAYQDQSRVQLRRDLATQSAREQRDLDNYNREKAALTEASARNLDAGIQSGLSYAALAYNDSMEDKRSTKFAEDMADAAKLGWPDTPEMTPIKIAGPLPGVQGSYPLPATLPGILYQRSTPADELPNATGYPPGVRGLNRGMYRRTTPRRIGMW